MFGYVTAQKEELKMREFYKYKAYYCGLCKKLKERYGFLGQLTLTYDMTFLIILLTSLYEVDTVREEHRCVVHPMKKQKMLFNEVTEYTADMNIVLTYYHLLDDWNDEGSKLGFAGTKAFHRAQKKIAKKYPEKCQVIKVCLDRLSDCEKRNEQDIDVVSRCFGELMSELFVWKKDCWEQMLRDMGFYLGKFIYLLDAYDDIEKDKKEGNYNVLLSRSERSDFDEKCEEMIAGIMTECTSRFEQLPCIEDAEILRNILYAGVWDKFDKKRLKKEGEEKNDSKSL